MSYILVFGIGVLIGFLITAIASSSGHSNRIQEAYNEGYEMGLGNSQNKNNQS